MVLYDKNNIEQEKKNFFAKKVIFFKFHLAFVLHAENLYMNTTFLQVKHYNREI